MSEIYTKIYSIPSPMYSDGMPMLITSGELLNNLETGKTVFKIEFINLSEKNVVGCDICAEIDDTIKIDYSFAGISVKCHEKFSAEKTVQKKLDSVKDVKFKINKIDYDDGTSLNGSRRKYYPLPKQTELSEIFDFDILQEYKQKNGNIFSKYKAEIYKQFWICSCGVINPLSEKKCSICSADLDRLVNYDLDALYSSSNSKKIEIEEKIQLELEENNRISDQMVINDEISSQKRNKTIMIIAAVIAFLLVAATLIISLVLPNYKYKKALKMLDEGQYDSAYAILSEMDKYGVVLDNKYDRAEEYEKNGDYESAYELYNGLNYKDSRAKASNCFYLMKKDIFENDVVGDLVYFGKYDQDNISANSDEPLEWTVIAKEDNRMLLVTSSIIECSQYHNMQADTVWNGCSLRSWLNREFFNNTFSDDEASFIITSDCVNAANPKFGTGTSDNTADRIFLLSIDEALQYFSANGNRAAKGTDYAFYKGLSIGADGFSEWLLRSSGQTLSSTAYIDGHGVVNYVGCDVSAQGFGVRPAMWIAY